MKGYFFIHGKNPSLSKYEVQSLFGKEVVSQNDALSLVETEKKIDQKTMDRMGGTIKICEVFPEDPVDVIERDAKKNKIVFGLSQYGGHQRLSEILLGLKNKLKNKGHNARFMNKDYTNISSGQLNKTGLLDKGVDLVRCFFLGKEMWAKTIAYQDIDSYSKRDYEKPRRDMKVGMMPPKLCQMMINFGQLEQGTTLYDPFCGLGSILMEGLLMGYPIMGSDIKGRLIDSTLKNLGWLEKEFKIVGGFTQNPDPQQRFFQHDATQDFPSKKFPHNLAVVTESYLGPALLRAPHQEKQQEIFSLLHDINSKFFSGISQIIKKGNRLVICFPFFRVGKNPSFYPEEFIKEYEESGYKIQHELRTLLYERQNQVVGREVVVFERN